jgi:hypothetical protein
MAMEELEEMEPGFAIRFDEEWERIFNKKKDSVLPIGDGEKTKSKKFGKKVSERSDPIHQDREGTSHQAQSLAMHRYDRPLYTSEYDSEYDEESSEYDNEYTTTQLRAHAVIKATTTTTARTTSTGLSKWRSGRGEIVGSKENYTRATNQGGCSFPQGANRQQMRNQRLLRRCNGSTRSTNSGRRMALITSSRYGGGSYTRWQ